MVEEKNRIWRVVCNIGREINLQSGVHFGRGKLIWRVMVCTWRGGVEFGEKCVIGREFNLESGV